VHPVSLRASLGKDISQHSPQAQRPVSYRHNGPARFAPFEASRNPANFDGRSCPERKEHRRWQRTLRKSVLPTSTQFATRREWLKSS
jgi:hypothetical protein